MGFFRALKNESKNITRHFTIFIPIIAILFIPVIYAGTFLYAFWNPYGKLDHLPVAIVNADKGAIYNDKPIHIGDDLVQELKKKKTFQYHFVTEKEADKGIKNYDYFMVITIPSNFSKNIASLKKASITYVPNKGFNYIVSQIGDKAVSSIKNDVADSITKEYASSMLQQIRTLSNGMKQADKGSNNLLNGIIDSKNGVSTLYQSLNANQSKTNDLWNGSNQLLSGILTLQSGMNNTLNGSNTLKNNSVSFSNNVSTFTNGVTQVANGMNGLDSSLKTFLSHHPELANDSELLTLIGTTDGLSSSLNTLNGQSFFVQTGAEQLSNGVSSLYSGISSLNSGVLGLVTGGKSVAGGNKQFSSSWKELTDNIGTLNNGMNQLSDGAFSLHSRLADASSQLSKTNTSNDVANVFSKPITLEEKDYSSVDNYGIGFTPYFLSLGLFVGALLTSIVYSFTDYEERPSSGFAWYFSKLVVLMFICIFQSLIADFIILHFLGLKVISIPKFLLFSMFTSMMFMTLIQLLVSSMKNVGRFIAIIVLILQLTSSSGSYPSVLIPDALQHLSRYLPMTYTIGGFRSIVSIGDMNLLSHNTWILAIFMGSFLLLSLVYYLFSFRLSEKK